MGKPTNELPRERRACLVPDFRICSVLSGLACPACGSLLSANGFVRREEEDGIALRCSGCHRDAAWCELAE